MIPTFSAGRIRRKLSDRFVRAGLAFLILGTAAALVPTNGNVMADTAQCGSSSVWYKITTDPIANDPDTHNAVFNSGSTINYYVFKSTTSANSGFSAVTPVSFSSSDVTSPTVSENHFSGTAGTSSNGFVTATFSGVSVTANFTVNQAPQITTPAYASSSPVTSTSTPLNVVASDDGGSNNLSYKWTIASVPNGTTQQPSFSDSTAVNPTVTFHNAGPYGFSVTVKDAGGLMATSSANVTVNQTVSNIALSYGTLSHPPNAWPVGTQITFSAPSTDQFGHQIASPNLKWSFTGGSGNINSSTGDFTPGAHNTTYTIKASSQDGTVSSTINVTTN